MGLTGLLALLTTAGMAFGQEVDEREPTQRQRLRFACQDVRGDSMPPLVISADAPRSAAD